MHTRSDIAESMVGLNRLPFRIESRKLQFLHKIITLPAGSVSGDRFIRKRFINDQSLVTLGYVPVICQLLLKYNLQGIINNLLLLVPCISSKRQWKTLVKHAIDNTKADSGTRECQQTVTSPSFAYSTHVKRHLSYIVFATDPRQGAQSAQSSVYRQDLCH